MTTLITMKVSYKNEIRRFSCEHSFSSVIDSVKELFHLGNVDQAIQLSYLDDDNDKIIVSTQHEFLEAILIQKSMSDKNVYRFEVIGQESTTQTSAVHSGITCDGCGMVPIIGTRYKCSIREDFDLCENCEKHDGSHPMLKISHPDFAPREIFVVTHDDKNVFPRNLPNGRPLSHGPNGRWGRAHPPHGMHHPPHGMHHQPHGMHHQPHDMHHQPHGMHHQPHGMHHQPHGMHPHPFSRHGPPQHVIERRMRKWAKFAGLEEPGAPTADSPTPTADSPTPTANPASNYPASNYPAPINPFFQMASNMAKTVIDGVLSPQSAKNDALDAENTLIAEAVRRSLEEDVNAKPCARFCRDVTFPDGSIVLPGSLISKTWRIRNDGQSAWPTTVCVSSAGGDLMGFSDNIPVEPMGPNSEVDITVQLIAPSKLGRYVGYFRLREGQNKPFFGQRFWIDVRVVDDEDQSIWVNLSNSDGNEKVDSPKATYVEGRTVELDQQLDQIIAESATHVTGTFNEETTLYSRELEMLSSMGFSDINVTLPLLKEYVTEPASKKFPSDSQHSEGMQKVVGQLLNRVSRSADV